MKKLPFLLAFFCASACLAATAWVYPAIRQVFWGGPPPRVSLASGETRDHPDFAFMTRAGIYLFEYDCPQTNCIVDWDRVPAVREMTQAELDARAAQDAADATNQAYQATLPVPMPTGIEVPWVVFLDATNRQKGIAMELTTNNVPIYYEFHASPVNWARVDSNRAAAMAKWELRVKAIKNAKSQGGGLAALGVRVAALEAAVAGVE